MSEMDDQLEALCKDIKKAVPDVESQAKITKAGAEVYAKVLKENTPYNEKRKKTEVKHLRDSIEVQAKNVDNVVDGSSVVGFENSKSSGINHARVALFQNNGTAKDPNPRGKNFVDKSIEQAKPDVFAAMEKAWRSGGDNN